MAVSAAVGDIASQNAPVRWQGLPQNHVISGSYGSGDATYQSLSVDSRKAVADRVCQSSSDDKTAVFESDQQRDNFDNSVRQLSRLLQVTRAVELMR